jgi:predicted glycosyltransferase
LRVVVYCQPLTGLGHFVRAVEVSRALAGAHEVHFATGGRRFPGDRDVPGVRFVELAPLHRADGKLAPVEPGRALADVLADRARALRRTVAELSPDALLVEHFPFGKFELADEAATLVDAARAARPGVKVLCSLRDIALRSRYDVTEKRASEDDHAAAVCGALAQHFDALLVHGDPAVTRLDAQLSWSARIPVPVFYTGYVSRKPVGGRAAGGIVVSAGGGVEAEELVGPALEAWRLLRERGATGGRTLTVYAGPFAPDAAFRALAERCAGAGAEVHRFTPDLVDRIAGADLSLSRAGYNTCTNVLETRARALLVPSSRMADQPLRAGRLAELGLVATLAPGETSPGRFADTIAAALRRARPRHSLDLDGAARTCRLVEALVRGDDAVNLALA